jgi:hypothetical protein
VRSTIGIDVDAPPELVFRLARDVERLAAAAPLRRGPADPPRPGGALVAQMVARRPLVPALGLSLPVAWRARTWSDEPTLPAAFVHGAARPTAWTSRGGSNRASSGSRVETTTTSDRTWAPGQPSSTAASRARSSRTLASFWAIAEAVAT